MNTQRRPTSLEPIRYAWTRFAWLACGLMLFAASAQAQRVEGDRAVAQGLYEAEVPVSNQTESAREAAFARGLAQVLGKLSGDRSAASRPGVGKELRRAKDFVEGYDYRQDESRSASGAPSYSTTLVVRFRQEDVDGIAAALGLPVWPQPRPKPVLWLAIDDGKGPRLVALAQSEVARSALNRAIERGYRLGLPSGGAAEQAVVGAIWRGDSAAIARLSARYSPPMQLIGKLYRSEGGWKADWIFVDRGRVLANWSGEDANARRAMATGADGAADALTKRYAKVTTAPPGIQRVVFTGIDSSEDFIRLSAYLQSTSVVRGIVPVKATPDNLEVDLDLLTGLPGLRRVLNKEVLAEAEGNIEGVPPVFVLR
jgi:hypothetical protein